MTPQEKLEEIKNNIKEAKEYMGPINWRETGINGESIEWLIARVEQLEKALEEIGVCVCDARFSGNDEAEYRARGCPSCSCESDYNISRKALSEMP